MDTLRALLRLRPPRPPATETLSAWWAATEVDRRAPPLTIDRALAGGALADRLGFAFAAGYREALCALVPDRLGSGSDVTALCVTEAGGNHPRAIATTLVATGDGAYELTGHKKWATVGSLAQSLLVAASTGRDGDRNTLGIVRVAASAPGVTITASAAPFIPEIPHAEIAFDRVRVTSTDILPGDGYTDYVKPFRTIEDAHVHAAVLGYLIGVATRHSFPRANVERLLALALATRAAALADTKSPVTHVVLAGIFTLVRARSRRARSAMVGVARQRMAALAA